jgi:hypothetical protein
LPDPIRDVTLNNGIETPVLGYGDTSSRRQNRRKLRKRSMTHSRPDTGPSAPPPLIKSETGMRSWSGATSGSWTPGREQSNENGHDAAG